MTISLCMIVKNEEAMLAHCLDSVQDVVDEIIIVDTGSTDHTVEIAERYDARIYVYPWDGSFSNARNYAMKLAVMDWILIIDADNVFEKQDKDKLRSLTSADAKTTAYYCKTLSFLGEAPDAGNVICNLNICLVRNHMGYRFTGSIHEQIYCSDPAAKAVTAISDMRIYHYGYLNSAIRTQSKRERNISMIQKELDKRPDDPFMLYNLGNEFYAQLKIKEAYECYLKSYAHFAPDAGFSPRLLLRLVVCCEAVGDTAQQLRFIDEGLKIYPLYTDLEFIRGSVWLKKERYLAAIHSFKKCLEMGEPPILLGYLTDVGTVKPAQMLCQIYHNLGDPKNALRYVKIALDFQPFSHEVCAQLSALLIEKMPPEAAAKKLSRLLPADSQKYLLISDVFYSHHRYDVALDYTRKALRHGCDPTLAKYNQGICLFYLKRYQEACARFESLAGSAYESRASFLSRLCVMFDSNVDQNLPRGDEPYFSVLERFETLMADKSCAPLAADEQSSIPYIAPIMSLLDILIKSERLEEFEKARRLLNLIKDDSVLMRLGKLYFRNGYLKPAYRELERSIKLTGKTDGEALRMMKYILDSRTLI